MKMQQSFSVNFESVNKVTLRDFEVFLKQSHDSSDDYKFPATANETLSEQTDVYM